jgi:2-desacetyl-2-hydroxyethyl bacteriochlorophyllide A dehydrogenase
MDTRLKKTIGVGMKAAVFKKKGVLKVEEVPRPEPGVNDVLLQITHCAICGSDLHRYQYGMMSPGTIMGHEYSGRVVEIGSKVENFQVGDRAAPSGGKVNPVRDIFSYPPRYSAKERGFMPGQRAGAYAEFMVVDADGLMKVPETVSNLEACLVEPLTVSLHAVRLSSIKLGDRVLVIGAGPIGLLVQQCTALAGAGDIFVSETNLARRKIASILGADVVFNPIHENMLEEIIRKTGVGVDLAFECAGAQATLQEALGSLRVAGRVIVVSLAWEPVNCTPVDWVGREVEMKTSYGTLASEWHIAMKLLEKKKIQVKPIISYLAPLEDIQDVFQKLLNPETPWIQAVVTFE